MTTRDVVFLLVGLVAGASAILSVTTRQVVHAALWLVVSLGTLAGCYVVLGAELVALVQVLIYVGAVVVLVLFALMLTRAPIGRQTDLATPLVQRIAAAVLGVATTGLLLAMLVPLVGQDPVTPVSGDTRAVATAIFGTWVWPFELLSVLLLAALIGAFAVARVAGAISPQPARPTRPVPRTRRAPEGAPASSPAPSAAAPSSAAPSSPPRDPGAPA